MAAHLSPCSSSSTSFTPSSFKNKTAQFSKFITLIREGHSPKWVSQIRPRIHPRNGFQLKSSNGHPLDAVSCHGGPFLDSSLVSCYMLLSHLVSIFLCVKLLISFISYLIDYLGIRIEIPSYFMLRAVPTKARSML